MQEVTECKNMLCCMNVRMNGWGKCTCVVDRLLGSWCTLKDPARRMHLICSTANREREYALHECPPVGNRLLGSWCTLKDPALSLYAPNLYQRMSTVWSVPNPYPSWNVLTSVITGNGLVTGGLGFYPFKLSSWNGLKLSEQHIPLSLDTASYLLPGLQSGTKHYQSVWKRAEITIILSLHITCESVIDISLIWFVSPSLFKADSKIAWILPFQGIATTW